MFEFVKNLLKGKVLVEPTPIDYSKIIEVGDTVGFKWADHYMEGVVIAILKDHTCLEQDDEYVVNITNDKPLYLNLINYVGRTKIVDFRWTNWTILEKHDKCDVLPISCK